GRHRRRSLSRRRRSCDLRLGARGLVTVSPALVVDTHTHSVTYLPRLPAGVFRAVVRGHPEDVTFADAHAAGVHAIVAKAVGDPLVTRWHFRAPFQAVENQFASIRDEAAAAVPVLL